MRYGTKRKINGGYTRRTGTPRKNEKLQSLLSKWLSTTPMGFTGTLRQNGPTAIRIKQRPLPYEGEAQ